MKRLITILVISTVGLVGCGDSPTAPSGSGTILSSEQGDSSGPEVETPPQPPTAPPPAIPGGPAIYLLSAPGVWTPSTGYVDATTVYTEDNLIHWVIEDGGAWDRTAYIEKSYSFDDSPGSARVDGPHVRNNDDIRWFWEAMTNRIHVFVKKGARFCGRFQADLNVTMNGQVLRPFGIIVDYTTECGKADRRCDGPKTVEWSSVYPEGGMGHAYFSVAERSVGITVYLSSYVRQGAGMFPQSKYAETAHVMTLGENRIKVPMSGAASPSHQLDLACVAGPDVLKDGHDHADLIDYWPK